MAISLASPDRSADLETAAAVAGAAMTWRLRAPAGTALNVNVADPLLEVVGVGGAPLARFGTVEAQLARLRPGEIGRMRRRIAARADATEVRSDATLLAAGYVTAPPVSPVCGFSGKTGVAEALRGGLRSRQGSWDGPAARNSCRPELTDLRRATTPARVRDGWPAPPRPCEPVPQTRLDFS